MQGMTLKMSFMFLLAMILNPKYLSIFILLMLTGYRLNNIQAYYHYIEVCGLQFKGKSRIWGFALYSSESGQILFLVTPISPFVCFSEDHNVFLKFLSCLHWVT